MNLTELQKIGKKLYYPLFLLEGTISHRKRKPLAEIFLILTISLFSLLAVQYGLSSYLYFIDLVSSDKLLGAAMVSFSVWFALFASNAFFYSFYFSSPKYANGLFIDFDLAYSIDRLWPNDITGSFFASLLGSRFILRTGIKKETMKEFLLARKFILTADKFKCEAKDNILNLTDFTLALYESDSELKQFLFAQGIQRKDLMAIAEWIMEVHAARHLLEGWWAKGHLGQISGIGESWSYGKTFRLERYQRPLPFLSSLKYGVRASYGEAELKSIETALAKTSQGNVLLVGDDIAGQLQIIKRLEENIQNNLSLPELRAKRVVVLDTAALTSSNGEKSRFESEFTSIIREATLAGNIILVIDNMASFVSSALSFGTDLPSLFGPYLSSPTLKVVALSSKEGLHEVLERHGSVMQYFEIVHMKEADDSSTIKILENEAAKFESRGALFTYLALSEIAQSATRYFPDAIMPDKAIDLLTEVVPKILASGKTIIEKSDIQKLVEEKTGIPVGEMREEEKEKLLNLENILHSRIVGQKEAIKAISTAMRRARSGIENSDRPLGSFLFLGPTGVGKTETAKALAQTFFDSENRIMRLDMSEYSSFDSVSKLIGSFESKEPGILSSMLREHPYGVLLLGEFEKTTKEVMNLFLQILDEGFFSDMYGKKIIARNLIIIATTNAGSDLISEAQKSGRNLLESKESIVDEIIKLKIFNPELLNRFDGVILFHPLSEEQMRRIAELSLSKLKNRLAEKGMLLVINDALVDFVLKNKADPKFGARPINRAIQENVEEWISRKIIEGSLKPGSQIVWNPET